MGKKVVGILPDTWKPIDLEKRLFEIEEEKQKKRNELTAISKPLYKLVFSENFLIEKILGESHAESFTPTRVVGGYSPSYDTGYSSSLVIKVLPEREIPVRTLSFDGFFPGVAGNKISARIPRYKEKEIDQGYSTCFGRETEKLYFDRKFRKSELAIELSILSPDERILRTDRAVNYFHFVKK